MLWWIVDNLSVVLLALGIVALCFGAGWWTTRRNKLLYGVAVPGVLMLFAWVLSLFIVTDRMRLVRDVEEIRDQVNAGKLDDAIRHFDAEVTVDTVNGEHTFKSAAIRDLAKKNMGVYGVKKVNVWGITVEQVARPKATVAFFIGPEDSPERGRCTMQFVLASDGKWRVRMFGVESVIGGHKSPLLFPF
jgi:hypothetical protein